MTRFLGVDLAWAEGSSARPANETGLACIDETGHVIDAGWARGTDAVVHWIQSLAEPGAVLAIDAPLVVDNPAGMRVCERETGSRYGRWHVSANASNLARPWQGGVSIRDRLEALGWAYTDGLSPVRTGQPSFFECYPYTTLVGAAEFGYDDKRPRYKRMGASLPIGERRAARAEVCDDLIQRLWGLHEASPPAEPGLAPRDGPARHRAIAPPRPRLQAQGGPDRRAAQRVDGLALVAPRLPALPGPRGRRHCLGQRPPGHDHRARPSRAAPLRPPPHRENAVVVTKTRS